MTFTFEYTAKDLAYHYRRRPNSLTNWYAGVLWLAIAAAGAIFLQFKWDELGYAYLVLFVAAPFIQWAQPRYLKRILLASPSFRGLRTMHLGFESVRIEHPTFKVDYLWSYFTGYQEQRYVFLLFATEITAFPIPKSSMTEQDANALRDLLRQKLSVVKN